MMKVQILAGLVMSMLVVAGCERQSSTANRESSAPAPSSTAERRSSPTTQPVSASAEEATAVSATPVNKNCAVEQDHAIDPKVTLVWNGKTYGFCCKDCIDEFKKDPQKYANAK